MIPWYQISNIKYKGSLGRCILVAPYSMSQDFKANKLIFRKFVVVKNDAQFE